MGKKKYKIGEKINSSELKEKDPSTYEKYERLVKKAEKREQ